MVYREDGKGREADDTTIKEIETLSGMERATIRFYEREGILSPMRMKNEYRDYSEDDLQMLLRVKLLRSLHIPLDEIKTIKGGSRELPNALSEQITKLAQEKQDVSYAQDMCRAIREDGVAFAELDAKKYLAGIARAVEETNSLYFALKSDASEQVFHPWRRYLARMLDIFIYEVGGAALLAFAFHVSLAARSALAGFLGSYIAIAMMLILEPIWLHRFGTTPGKAVFGLRIEAADGRRLSYGEGFARTWGVISAGMGYNIPIYSLVRLWKSCRLCSEKEAQPWDEAVSYTLKDTKWYRGALFIGAYAAIVAALLTIGAAQRLPPHRGDLTVAEFAENHNYYAKLFGVDLGEEYLSDNGKWVKKESDGTVYSDGTAYLEIDDIEKPAYHFTVENGYVTGVSFEAESEKKQNWLSSYDAHITLASLAFVGAQDEAGLFSKIPQRVARQIQNSTFQDFAFTEAGIAFACDTEYSGYTDTQAGFLLPEESAAEPYFCLNFSMNKLK